MLAPLLLGSLMLVMNMAIQVVFAVIMLRLCMNYLDKTGNSTSNGTDMRLICWVMAVLFAGHLLQFASWAALFMWLGEFSDFHTAFYHSTVNFTSLGYGDIVMSERWRLLGGLEAANGVLMFGLTAGTLLAVMTQLFQRRQQSGDAQGG